jgi:hypothetical protein
MTKFLRTVFQLTGLIVVGLGVAVGWRPVDSAQSLSGEGGLGLAFVSHYGGTTNSVALLGDYLLVSKGPKVIVMDISDPIAPVEVAHLMVARGVADIEIAGNYAYMATSDGLSVLDVSEPTAPMVIGAYETAASGLALAVKDNYAYVAAGAAGLYGIDITNPAVPVAVDVLETTSWDVRVDENYAYVADWWGLTIVNILDPTNLSEAGEYQNSYMQGFDVDNQYLYVPIYPNLVKVFDGSDPANLVEVGSYLSPYESGFDGVLVDGNYAYLLVSSCESVACGSAALTILDISNPNEPAEVGSTGESLGKELRQVVLDGDYAYVAAGWNGLQVVDINPLATPELVASFGPYLSADSVEIAPNRYLYVVVNQPVAQYTNVAGVQVINGSNPLNLQPASFIVAYYSVADLDVEGDYAFLVHNGRHDGSLSVYDVSNPAAPQGASGWLPAEPFPPDPMYGVTVSDGYAYVSTGSIYKLEVSNSGQVAEVDAYLPSFYPEDLVVQGNVGYAWGSSGGLSILSLDPLQEIGYLNIHVENVSVTGDYAYVLGGGGVRILDVTNPAVPVEVGFYDTPGDYSPNDVLFIGEYAYLAGSVGLRVLDVSDPANVVEVGFYDTGGATRDVAFDGKYLYVLDGYSGLFVYEVTGLVHQFNLPVVMDRP